MQQGGPNVVVGEHLEVPDGRRGPDVRGDVRSGVIFHAAGGPRQCLDGVEGLVSTVIVVHQDVARRPRGACQEVPAVDGQRVAGDADRRVRHTSVATMTTSTSVISSAST